jgi:hypothetical protein
MPRAASIFAAIVAPTLQVASAATLIPSLGAVGDLLAAIITLCDSVPQNRHVTIPSHLYFILFKLTHLHRNAARLLAQRCQQLCISLKQYETIQIPDRMVPRRDDVFKSVPGSNTTDYADGCVDASRKSKIRCRNGAKKAGSICWCIKAISRQDSTTATPPYLTASLPST